VSLRTIEKLREFAVLIRIQNLGTSITAVMGALSVQGFNLRILDFLMLFSMAVIINVGGQIINDIKDLEIDKNSKELQNRPLVKKTISMKTAYITVFTCLFLLLFIAFIYFGNYLALAVLFSSMFVGYLYNAFSKKLPGADFFLSISFALFCLYGAIVVTDNFQSFSQISTITWIIVALVFIHVQIMNSMEGGLKDAKNDREAGAKTIAVTLGVIASEKEMKIPASFKIFNLFFVILTAMIPFLIIYLIDFEYTIIQLVLIIFFVILMLFSAIVLLSMKSFDKKKIKFHIRNHELSRFALVPVILLESIGVYWALFLIFFPVIWFIITNYIFYKESWSKPKLY
jgi:4-hydroxybenzoate polyprenyltransferase